MRISLSLRSPRRAGPSRSAARDARACAPRLFALLLVTTAGTVAQTPGHVLDEAKINAAHGGFSGTISPQDLFGSAVAPIGDLDGDGIDEVAVGAPDDDDGGAQRGAVWILFFDESGAVRTQRKISQTAGDGFPGQLGGQGRFGMSLAPLGDLDGDGVVDLAVGAPWTNDGGAQRGAVWILFLSADGGVHTAQRISDTKGDFTGVLKEIDRFGRALAPLGDLDGDGVVDLAVGAFRDHDGGHGKGAVWILFLERDGTVKAHQKISDFAGDFDGVLVDDELLGTSLATLGDLDGDGVVDLAAGAPGQQEVSMSPIHGGTLWILFLRTDGTVRREQKIGAGAGGFTGTLAVGDGFGASVAAMGDLDGDGVTELAVGANGDDEGGPLGPLSNTGAIWVLSLTPQGTVRSHTKVSAISGGFDGALGRDEFATALSWLGDLDDDGRPELAVGAPKDGETGLQTGAVWLLDIAVSPWMHHGGGVAGGVGAPTLVGEGALLGGDALTLRVTSGPPAAVATLVAGASRIDVAFKHGVLVPALDVVLPGLVLDGGGALTLVARWPFGIPPGQRSYFQCWILDPTAPAGFAASNAISGEAR